MVTGAMVTVSDLDISEGETTCHLKSLEGQWWCAPEKAWISISPLQCPAAAPEQVRSYSVLPMHAVMEHRGCRRAL